MSTTLTDADKDILARNEGVFVNTDSTAARIETRGLVVSDEYTINGAGGAYAVQDFVCQDNGAGTAVPLSITMQRSAGRVVRARLDCSQLLLTNAEFRVHLFSASPTIDAGAGDNDAMFTAGSAGAVTYARGTYIGSMLVTLDHLFKTYASGFGYAEIGGGLMYSGATLYALIEARAAYVPVASQKFTLTLEVDY